MNVKLKDLKSIIGIKNNPKKYSAPYQTVSNPVSSYYGNETRYSIPGSTPAIANLLNPNSIYFTIEATEGNLEFYFQVFVVDDDGPDLSVEVTWGDGTNSTSDILAGGSVTINHTFPNAGLFSGTLCVDTPSRVRRIDADIND
jgi:hypothetical protein